MKKTLLSLAVVAMALPAISVAQDSGPTVFGRADVGVARIDDGTNDVFEVQNNASRFGIKGEEDLGGITGFYHIEFGVDIDDGEGPISQRNQVVGLKGDFGSAFVGRYDSPFKEAQGKVDLFSDQVDMKAYIAGEERVRNIIGYSTPNMGGLTLKAMLQPGEGSTDNEGETEDSIADGISVSAEFETEMLFAAVAYDMNMDYSFWEDANSVNPLFIDDSGSDALRLTGVVKLDNFGFGALYQMAEQADVAAPAEQDALVLSAYAMMDQTKFEFQYALSEHEQGTAEIDIDFLGLGIEQQLSERTTLYAILARQTIDIGSPTDVDQDIAMVGAQHNF